MRPGPWRVLLGRRLEERGWRGQRDSGPLVAHLTLTLTTPGRAAEGPTPPPEPYAAPQQLDLLLAARAEGPRMRSRDTAATARAPREGPPGRFRLYAGEVA